MTQRKSPPSPPRARITFRVGIVGHRPNRLPTDPAALTSLQARLDEALMALRAAVDAFAAHPDAALYADEPPVLRAVTPLAEGTDRMFAEAALAVGCQLCCPMPFARREFENDFGGDAVSRRESVDHFNSLMDRARDAAGLTTFELDGSRDNGGEAYAAAGRVVLNQSDLLIVVWDGGAANGDGGTHDSLNEALRYSVPVLWIDALAEHGWMMVGRPADLEPAPGETRSRPRWAPASPDDDRLALAAALAAAVAGELAAPPALATRKSGLDDRDRALAYFAERKPGANFGFIWKLFRDLVGAGRLTAPSWRVPHFVDQIAHAWPTSHTDGGVAPSPVTAWTNESLRAHYAWADRRADLYGDAHRSAFVTISLLAVAAVFLALLPLAAGWSRLGEDACILAEFLVLILTVGLLWLGNTRRWHLRWLEYRVLAELIRQLRILIPLGVGRPMPSQPAHLAVYGDPTRLWMYWQMRAIARDVGIPNVTITPAFAGERVRYLRDITSEQIDYYVHAKRRSGTIHHRLHGLALMGFGLSIAAVVMHGLVQAIPWGPSAREISESLGRWLVLISAGAPAFGAALASINNQGEFARLEKRSGAMVASLGRVRDDLHALAERLERGEPVSLAEVIDQARAMAAMMVEENADWRVVVIDLAHGAS